ncbi:Dnaja4 [Symbiodinium sp. KB8]|nr:Dnaja4 [Symbiodinium sp. KB8]
MAPPMPGRLCAVAVLLVARAVAVCTGPNDFGRSPVGISATMQSDVKGKVTVQVLCGEDAAMAAARAATTRKTATSSGEAVLACARSLHEQLEKEAETGQIGYIAPQMLDEGTPQERYRLLKTGGQFSRRAAEHGRREEFAEAIADLLRALLRANIDETAREKLMRTMIDFLKKAEKKRSKTADDGDLSELFEALGMEDDGKDNADLDRAALKRTYRELSKKEHPDKNPESAERFNMIRDAYEILSDPVKMLLYDTGGMDLIKKYEKDGDGEIERVDNYEVTHDISLEEAYQGGEKEILVNRRVVCRSCRMRPDLQRCRKCQACPGQRQQRQVWLDQWHYRVEEIEVPSNEKCTWDRQKLKMQIERGTMFGDRAHFPHMGSQLPKHIPGDALVTLRVKKHPVFKRLGDDLMVDVRISLYEALLGFKRELTHLDGHIVNFSMERGDVLKPGAALEIQGEGMPHKEDPTSAGKLVIRFHIDFPQQISAEAGDALEAEFLNIAELPVREKRRVRAVDGDCTVKAIHRDDFQSSLQKFPEEAKVFDRFLREASRFAVPGAPFARVQEAAGRRILAFLEAGREFQGCQRDFLATLCTEAEGVLLAPGETLQAGDLPKGHCSLFIVLAGRIQVATPEGIVFRFAGPGEVLGSAAALDLVDSSTEALKALPGMGPAFCVRIPHAAVGRALQDCPSNAELWIKNAELLHREACRSKQERCRWAAQVAVPALASTSLLAGCPQDFLMSLAGQLSEVAHSEGDEIFACNTSGKSMMIVLEGCVELHAKSGREIGCVGAGAVIGEPEALGLLSFRTATAVAVTSCRLLPVSFEALTQALSAPTAATLKESYASSIVKSYGNEVAELIQAQYALGCEVDAVEASGDPVKEEPVVATQLNGSGAGTMTSPSPVGVGTTLVPFAIMKHVYRKWLDGSISEATQAQVYGQQWLEAFQAILEHLVRWDSCSVFDVGELDGEFGGGES